MQLDELFPLALVPLRARKAILLEFGGRCPNLIEVATVSDRHWLECPGIGPATLKTIHSVISARAKLADTTSAPRSTDAELLRRLCLIQDDLRYIQNTLKKRILSSGNSKRREAHLSQVHSKIDASPCYSEGPSFPGFLGSNPP